MSFTAKKNYPQKYFQPRDVIERVLNEENLQQQSAAGVVAKELINVWIFCNVYPANEITIKQKIFALMKTFSSIDRYSKKKRGKSFLQKEAEFMRDIDELFDILALTTSREDSLKNNIYFE